MRRCILHVGTPKAGSTTIQGLLRTRREALAARGIDVPLFPENDVVKGGRGLADSLGAETDPASPRTPSWRWLDGRIAETMGDLCISRESFCFHLADAGQRAFLLRFFERRGVRLVIVAYLRDSVSFLNAEYAQHAKRLRLGDSFEEWVAPILDAPPKRYAFRRLFEPSLADGGADLVLRPLAMLGPGGLVADFLGHLGCADLDLAGFDARAFRNATPGPKAIAASIAAGRALAARGIAPRLQKPLVRAFRAAVAERGWVEAPFHGPDEALARRIADRFAADNERLAAEAWGNRWEECAPMTLKARNVFDRDAASPAERAEIDDLVAGFLARHVDRSPWSRLARWVGAGRRNP